MVDFEKLFDDFTGMKIAVLGDVMLDTYWWGKVERISPEAPVPVVALDRKEYRIGGQAMWRSTFPASGQMCPFFLCWVRMETVKLSPGCLNTTR